MAREDERALVALLNRLDDTAKEVAWDTSAVELFRDARDVAEEKFPGTLGIAIAALLGTEALLRANAGVRGSLGASKTALALATAVLEA